MVHNFSLFSLVSFPLWALCVVKSRTRNSSPAKCCYYSNLVAWNSSLLPCISRGKRMEEESPLPSWHNDINITLHGQKFQGGPSSRWSDGRRSRDPISTCHYWTRLYAAARTVLREIQSSRSPISLAFFPLHVTFSIIYGAPILNCWKDE